MTVSDDPSNVSIELPSSIGSSTVEEVVVGIGVLVLALSSLVED